MPAEVVSAVFCADYAGVFEVPGSKKGTSYTVHISGSGGADCSCMSFKFRHECKHIDKVWKEGCFWNPQWHDGGPHTLRPVEIDSSNLVPSEQCPNCNGPVIAVRIAV